MARITKSYDQAAPFWGDKMRVLGYHDAYLGFLSAQKVEPERPAHVVDIGAGTGAFADCWVAIHGAPDRLTLIEPSAAMLRRATTALRSRGVEAEPVQATLDTVALNDADQALAAHVIEHCDDPLIALRQIRDILRPGGRLYLVVSKPHWCNVIIWFQWRHRTFGETEIRRLLQDVGFKIERRYAFPSGPPSRTSLGLVAVRVN